MDKLRLELYQVRNGMWKKSLVAYVTENQMSEVRDYFARNGMGCEEEKGVFKITSPFLGTALKEVERELQIKFVEQKARPVE